MSIDEGFTKDESPFEVGNVITKPEHFWGREWERNTIFNRLRNMESSSIVGPRRIGKTSLAHYIASEGQRRLGDSYEFVWLDGQSSHVTSASSFLNRVAEGSSLSYEPAEDLEDCLINFELSVQGHKKKLVLVVNEFELLTDSLHRDDFPVQFYNSIRLLAENGKCALITTSYTPLKEVCKYILGVSSPFYNIFEEIPLYEFKIDEAMGFLKDKEDQGFLTSSDIAFIKTIKSFRHPLILQIACDSIFRNRQNHITKRQLQVEIKNRAEKYINHDDVKRARKMEDQKQPQKLNRNIDLIVSVLVPVFGAAVLILVISVGLRELTDVQSIILALFSIILMFGLLVFAGRYVNIIRESTFFKLFMRLIDQIPLISNLVDRIVKLLPHSDAP